MLLVWIEAIGGLIENQHLGIMNQCLREAHPPAKSLRQRLDDLALHRTQPQALDDKGTPLAPALAAKGADVGYKIDELGHGHLAVARRALGQVTHAGFCGDRFALHVMAADCHGAGRRGQEACDYAHRR